MIADHMSSRVWVYDGEDRKVEIWLRHDGKFRVVRLHRLTGRKWREIDGVTVDDQFNAQAQAEHWRRLEEGRTLTKEMCREAQHTLNTALKMIQRAPKEG